MRRTQEAAEALAREAAPPGPATGPRPTGAPWDPTTGPAARPPAPDPGATWDARGASGGPADRGWTRPRAQEPRGGGVGDVGGVGGPELQALAALGDLLRSLVPAELQGQLVELVRQLLIAVRALIDWYLERLERRGSARVEVEDIPID